MKAHFSGPHPTVPDPAGLEKNLRTHFEFRVEKVFINKSPKQNIITLKENMTRVLLKLRIDFKNTNKRGKVQASNWKTYAIRIKGI